MRKRRHITVSVTPELYRQTRRLAAECDTTVSAMVAYLIEKLIFQGQIAMIFVVFAPKSART